MKKIFILIFGLFLYSILFAKQNVINITTDCAKAHNIIVIRTLQNTLYEELKKLAKSVGITQYKIGPLVRSSYHAASLAEK